ncbi:DHA2 family efflux MFS transporter permease subunit [Vibrio sp.]|nr:DHA2 family efflux MFS transporter permease subunit [Vibrio viridaestus]MDC0609743.1 DHA2 family efflux MFS transporter permease subunit [Vibrio sp.]
MTLSEDQVRRITSTLIVAAALFMEMIDSTVITTALPAIGESFNTAAANLSVSVSSYLVALTIFIPLSGWLAEKYGAKRLFCLAIVIFSFSSYLCSISVDVTTFTLSRILQGIGGAMMVPVGRYIVFRETPKEGLVTAVALLTWPALFAPVLGPVTGGWITENWGWTWIFIINIPIGIVVFLAAVFILPDVKRTPDLRFDTLGFILTALGFGGIMAGVELMNGTSGDYLLPGLLVTLGIVISIIAIRYLKNAQNPLFTLEPFKIHTFKTSSLSGSVFGVALSTVPFLFPLEMQLALGYGATESGAMLLWLFLGNLFMKPLTTWVMNQFGFRRILLINGCLIALSFIGLSLLTSETPKLLIGVLLFVSGMCRSMQFTAFNTLGMSDVPNEQMKDASMISSIVSQMNIGVGIAVASLILGLVVQFSGSTLTDLSVANFATTYLVVAVFTLLALLDIRTLTSESGDSVLHHKHG